MFGVHLAACFGTLLTMVSTKSNVIDGVTFCGEPGRLFVPLREAAEALEIQVGWDEKNSEVSLGDLRLKPKDFEQLFDGTKLIPLTTLKSMGVDVEKDGTNGDYEATYFGRGMTVREGQKRVEVSIDDQRLRAWQGGRVVLETNISSGRP